MNHLKNLCVYRIEFENKILGEMAEWFKAVVLKTTVR